MTCLQIYVQPEHQQQQFADTIQEQQNVYGVPSQQFVMVQQQKPPQDGLINASYSCSWIGLIIFGIILGPIGFVLGLVAKLNGDQRGIGAMIFGGVVTIISIILAVFLINSGML